jgi:hypothetical protein
MAHNVPFKEMMENMGWWMKEREFGLWHQAVQAETVKMLGFLLYLTWTMDTEYMQGLLEKKVNEHPYNAEQAMPRFIDICIHWRVIPLGVKGKIWEEEMVPVLHVECAKEHVSVVKAVLSDVYSANVKIFPRGINL